MRSHPKKLKQIHFPNVCPSVFYKLEVVINIKGLLTLFEIISCKNVANVYKRLSSDDIIILKGTPDLWIFARM